MAPSRACSVRYFGLTSLRVILLVILAAEHDRRPRQYQPRCGQ